MEAYHQHVRAARDSLIDLMHGWSRKASDHQTVLGYTYPLTDLQIRDDQLKVPFDTVAQIPIVNSQKGVDYQLRDKDKQIFPGDWPQVEGNGEEVFLQTPSIHQDTTFTIFARKLLDNGDNKYVVFLTETAEVKVGLDTTLLVEIKYDAGNNLELLDPNENNPPSNAPRIIFYGQSVTVVVRKSQQGVDYEPVYVVQDGEIKTLLPEGSSPKRGDLGDLNFSISLVYEDTDIRIRAKKIFESDTDRDDETELLDIILPLKVRANPALAITMKSGAVVDFNGSTSVAIAKTQSIVRYRLYHRSIIDHPRLDSTRSEFVVNVQGVAKLPDNQLLTIDVPGNPNNPDPVQVKRPVGGGAVWSSANEIYQTAGDFKSGTGGSITLPVTLSDDSLLLVKAQKSHQYGDRAILSEVQMNQALAILTRPDPNVALTLRVTVRDGAPTGLVQVRNGQQGVFYTFRLNADGEEILPPAYFHELTSEITEISGVGEMRIEVDFVVVAETSDKAEIVIESLPVNAKLYCRAKKAITAVTVDLAHPVVLPSIPVVQPVPDVVAGNAVELIVNNSLAAIQYQILSEGQVAGQTVLGNGSSLSLSSDVINQDTVLTLRSIHRLDSGHSVEFDQLIPVKIKSTG